MAPANCLDRISGSILLQRALPSIHALERKMILSMIMAVPTARVSRIGYIKKPPLLKKSMIAQNVSIIPPHSLFPIHQLFNRLHIHKVKDLFLKTPLKFIGLFLRHFCVLPAYRKEYIRPFQDAYNLLFFKFNPPVFLLLCLCVYPVTPEGEDQNPEQYDGHL